MTEPVVSRRHFNHIPLISLLAATTLPDGTPAAGQVTSTAPTRRDVIRQELPGEPRRDIILVEVTYPPATGSPPHLHANGVMAFVVSGTIVSKVGDGPEQMLGAPAHLEHLILQSDLVCVPSRKTDGDFAVFGRVEAQGRAVAFR